MKKSQKGCNGMAIKVDWDKILPGLRMTLKKNIQIKIVRKLILLILAGILIGIPLFVQNLYFIDMATIVGLYIVLAMGLNIIVGYAGLLDLGYAAFWAIGAYTSAILTTQFNMSFWLTIPIAIIFAGISGVIIGWPTLRLRSDYLAMVTLGFGEIVRISATNLKITGGADGIFGIPAPKIGSFELSQPWHFYYLTLILVVLSWIAASRLLNSRVGRAWACVRDDEFAAEAMGINRIWLKLLAFIVGAMWAGLVGAIYVSKMSAVAPESFTFMQSFMILLMVVLGGMGSVNGVTIGAIVIVALPELFRGFESGRYLAFGIALILMMLFRPQGLFPVSEKTSSGGGD